MLSIFHLKNLRRKRILVLWVLEQPAPCCLATDHRAALSLLALVGWASCSGVWLGTQNNENSCIHFPETFSAELKLISLPQGPLSNSISRSAPA